MSLAEEFPGLADHPLWPVVEFAWEYANERDYEPGMEMILDACVKACEAAKLPYMQNGKAAPVPLNEWEVRYEAWKVKGR